MFAAHGNAALAQRPFPRRPFPQRLLIGSWSFRHPYASMIVRSIAGIWDLLFGFFLLSYGYWVGLVPLAGSALLFWAVLVVAREQSESGRNGQN